MCERCDGRVVVDRIFLDRLQLAMGKLAEEIVKWATAKKINHQNMPVLREVGNVIEIVQMMR